MTVLRMDVLPLWVTVNSDSDPDSWDEEERLEVFNKVADWWPSAKETLNNAGIAGVMAATA